jgi:hypothetical protein
MNFPFTRRIPDPQSGLNLSGRHGRLCQAEVKWKSCLCSNFS